MIAPINEMDGFEVFTPVRIYGNSKDEIALTISKTGCRLTRYALEILRDPVYVVAFFDYRSKRLALTPGKRGMVNILQLSKQGNKPNTICAKSFIDELSKQTDVKFDTLQRYKVFGHQAKVVNPTLIFDLKSIKAQPMPVPRSQK